MNVLIPYKGELQTIGHVARAEGMNYDTIHSRYYGGMRGDALWSKVRIRSKPKKKRKPPPEDADIRAAHAKRDAVIASRKARETAKRAKMLEAVDEELSHWRTT